MLSEQTPYPRALLIVMVFPLRAGRFCRQDRRGIRAAFYGPGFVIRTSSVV